VNPAQVNDEPKNQTMEIRELPLANAEGLPSFHNSEQQQRKSTKDLQLNRRDMFASIASSREQSPVPSPRSQDNRESGH
jgi:hypothetical protein